MSAWPISDLLSGEGDGMETSDTSVNGMDVDDEGYSAPVPPRSAKRERDIEADHEHVERPQISKRVKSVRYLSPSVCML